MMMGRATAGRPDSTPKRQAEALTSVFSRTSVCLCPSCGRRVSGPLKSNSGPRALDDQRRRVGGFRVVQGHGREIDPSFGWLMAGPQTDVPSLFPSLHRINNPKLAGAGI